MSQKLKVGILGGTGMVGQRFIAMLEQPAHVPLGRNMRKQ